MRVQEGHMNTKKAFVCDNIIERTTFSNQSNYSFDLNMVHSTMPLKSGLSPDDYDTLLFSQEFNTEYWVYQNTETIVYICIPILESYERVGR